MATTYQYYEQQQLSFYPLAMKKVLIDTHILIWLAAGVNIGPSTLKMLGESSEIFVSTISILELRVKHSIGKLPESEAILNSIDSMGLSTLPFTAVHSEFYKIFNPKNKDPFDNALISIALQEKIPIVTTDKYISAVKEAELVVINARD